MLLRVLCVPLWDHIHGTSCQTNNTEIYGPKAKSLKLNSGSQWWCQLPVVIFSHVWAPYSKVAKLKNPFRPVFKGHYVDTVHTLISVIYSVISPNIITLNQFNSLLKYRTPLLSRLMILMSIDSSQKLPSWSVSGRWPSISLSFQWCKTHAGCKKSLYADSTPYDW